MSAQVEYKMEAGLIYKFSKVEFQEVAPNKKDYVTYEIEAYRDDDEVRHTNGSANCGFTIIKTEPEFLAMIQREGWEQIN
jgi:hypothetical protein